LPNSPTPERIQRRRTKGFRLPPNTICVTRPSQWGNPFQVGLEYRGIKTLDASHAVTRYKEWLETTHGGKRIAALACAQLRGKNLACYCKPGDSCHADVLLALVNSSS
jgi:hypothetical protein